MAALRMDLLAPKSRLLMKSKINILSARQRGGHQLFTITSISVVCIGFPRRLIRYLVRIITMDNAIDESADDTIGTRDYQWAPLYPGFETTVQ